MANPRDDRYYGPKPRRTPPAVDLQGGPVFQTGQGGRPVLPPISSAFPNSLFPVSGSTYSPNHYTTMRSTPGRYDYHSTVYNQWPTSNSPSAQPSPYNYYDPHDNNRFIQPNYSNYPGRSATAIPEDSRKLPPLNTSQPYGRDDRWHTPSYTAVPSNAPPPGHIRSPTASYPTPYSSYGAPSANYTYDAPTSHPIPIQPLSHSSLASAIPSAPRPTSPYGRSSSRGPQTSYSPPPVSPTSSEEPTIKKKRKRADAAQLKILLETYNRTAFPSTEERLELAKLLDMTPRSVQIWFQNRRQSMRQTRQSSATTSSQQAFSVSESMMEDMSSSAATYDMAPYPIQGTQPSPTLTSAHRRRSQEPVLIDPRKQQWSRAY